MKSFRIVGLTIALCLLCFTTASKAGDITLPSEIYGAPGEPVRVKASTVGTEVKWAVLDKGLFMFPPDEARSTLTAVVWALKPGTYRVWAWTSVNNKPTDKSECNVIIGDKPTPPGPPGPNPPPVPPPDPPVPPQSDLAKKLQTEYSADPAVSAAKKGLLLSLIGFYAGVAESDLLTKSPIDKVSSLLDILQKERQNFVPDSALVGIRRIVAQEMALVFGDDPDRLFTPELRDAAKKLFTTVSKALQEVK